MSSQSWQSSDLNRPIVKWQLDGTGENSVYGFIQTLFRIAQSQNLKVTKVDKSPEPALNVYRILLEAAPKNSIIGSLWDTWKTRDSSFQESEDASIGSGSSSSSLSSSSSSSSSSDFGSYSEIIIPIDSYSPSDMLTWVKPKRDEVPVDYRLFKIFRTTCIELAKKDTTINDLVTKFQSKHGFGLFFILLLPGLSSFSSSSSLSSSSPPSSSWKASSGYDDETTRTDFSKIFCDYLSPYELDTDRRNKTNYAYTLYKAASLARDRLQEQLNKTIAGLDDAVINPTLTLDTKDDENDENDENDQNDLDKDAVLDTRQVMDPNSIVLSDSDAFLPEAVVNTDTSGSEPVIVSSGLDDGISQREDSTNINDADIENSSGRTSNLANATLASMSDQDDNESRQGLVTADTANDNDGGTLVTTPNGDSNPQNTMQQTPSQTNQNTTTPDSLTKSIAQQPIPTKPAVLLSPAPLPVEPQVPSSSPSPSPSPSPSVSAPVNQSEKKPLKSKHIHTCNLYFDDEIRNTSLISLVFLQMLFAPYAEKSDAYLKSTEMFRMYLERKDIQTKPASSVGLNFKDHEIKLRNVGKSTPEENSKNAIALAMNDLNKMIMDAILKRTVGVGLYRTGEVLNIGVWRATSKSFLEARMSALRGTIERIQNTLPDIPSKNSKDEMSSNENDTQKESTVVSNATLTNRQVNYTMSFIPENRQYLEGEIEDPIVDPITNSTNIVEDMNDPDGQPLLGIYKGPLLEYNQAMTYLDKNRVAIGRDSYQCTPFFTDKTIANISKGYLESLHYFLRWASHPSVGYLPDGLYGVVYRDNAYYVSAFIFPGASKILYRRKPDKTVFLPVWLQNPLWHKLLDMHGSPKNQQWVAKFIQTLIKTIPTITPSTEILRPTKPLSEITIPAILRRTDTLIGYFTSGVIATKLYPIPDNPQHTGDVMRTCGLVVPQALNPNNLTLGELLGIQDKDIHTEVIFLSPDLDKRYGNHLTAETLAVLHRLPFTEDITLLRTDGISTNDLLMQVRRLQPKTNPNASSITPTRGDACIALVGHGNVLKVDTTPSKSKMR